MPYYRRAAKRPRYGKKAKYSVQQKALDFVLAGTTTSKIEVIPPSEVEGMRKVKHLTISLAPDKGGDWSFYWAMVYVPQGTGVGDINVGVSGLTPMYEPNQFVMNCGVIEANAGPIRFYSPIARNLNDGDAIYLLVKNTKPVSESVNFSSCTRYAITLN